MPLEVLLYGAGISHRNTERCISPAYARLARDGALIVRTYSQMPVSPYGEEQRCLVATKSRIEPRRRVGTLAPEPHFSHSMVPALLFRRGRYGGGRRKAYRAPCS